MEISDWNIVLILGLYGAVGAYVNHIDDTDETYGYWEPLHFLLHGSGMQTWEYSPDFAIRTYAFVLPLTPIAGIATAFGLDKIQYFFICKCILGVLFALSTKQYIYSLQNTMGNRIALLSLVLLLCSPGQFFCATALLPSAVCASLVMLSFSSWLMKKYTMSILYGSIAVIWSGWPFVGVLFAPLGLYMLVDVWSHPLHAHSSTDSHKNKLDSSVSANDISLMVRILGVGRLALSGVAVVLGTAVGAIAIDSYMYGKITFPPLNIAMYNAFGGTGDELYGVEPASYYIRNLLLMMGLATFPLAVSSPLLLVISQMLHFKPTSSASRNASVQNGTQNFWTTFTLFAPALLWLGIMFSRPHKEERFMYPIYPILAVMAAFALETIIQLLLCCLQSLPLSQTSAAMMKRIITRTVRVVVLVVALAGGLSRVLASHRNFGGYFRLWIKTNSLLSSPNPSHMPPLNLCMGGDWYTFPSHFFLPNHVNFSYVADNFHGLLPQPYTLSVGTAGTPLLPVNGLNAEEMSHYVPLASCSHLVMTTPSEKFGIGQYTPLQRRVLLGFEEDSASDSGFKNKSFKPIHCENILDALHSSSALHRAFFIPFFTPTGTNVFMQYCLYSQE